MHPLIRYIAASMVIVAVAVVPAAAQMFDSTEPEAQAEASDGEAMLFDAVVVRPFGILATAIGSAVFVVTLPFTAATKNTSDAYEKLVVDPAQYTFNRKLGDFKE
jgi:hypothetical protein